MRNDAEVQQAVKAQFLGIVPERAGDLERLWSECDLQFNLLEDEGEVVMEGGAYRFVRFNHRALRVIWVSSFAAWEAFKCSADAANQGTTRNHDKLKILLELALTIRNAPNPEEVPLLGLPEPGVFPDAESEPELRAASELAVFASGWAMLHEVHHVMHQREGTAYTYDSPPEDKWAEELSCDSFATLFVLENAADYAQMTGQDSALVLRKRSMGIYFAMFALTILAHDQWSDSPTHPAVQKRMNATRNHVSGDAIDDALSIAALAFSSLEDVWPSVPKY